jgi:hypothetical protein
MKSQMKMIQVKKGQIGEYSMKNLIISILILIMLAGSSQSFQAINISQKNNTTILTNVSCNLGNQSNISINATQNQTNEMLSINSTDVTATNLWYMGKIPKGYELDKYGTVTGLTD